MFSCLDSDLSCFNRRGKEGQERGRAREGGGQNPSK